MYSFKQNWDLISDRRKQQEADRKLEELQPTPSTTMTKLLGDETKEKIKKGCQSCGKRRNK